MAHPTYYLFLPSYFADATLTPYQPRYNTGPAFVAGKGVEREALELQLQ